MTENFDLDKYLALVGCYIYDKRTGQNGMLTDVCIRKMMGRYYASYNAYISKTFSIAPIFVEDFVAGNVVFLRPFSVGWLQTELAEMGRQQDHAIRTLFGDDFRDEMIVSITEEERQGMMRRLAAAETGMDNWDCYCSL